MAVNRVDYAGQTLIDLSNDTVAPAGLLNGITAHDRTGNVITGTLVAGPANMYFSTVGLTTDLGGRTGSWIIPINQNMTDWLVAHYNTPGLTINLMPSFQINKQYSVLSTWATDSLRLGVTTYGLAAYNGTTASAIGNVTIRSQSDSVLADARSNFAIRVSSSGEVSVWSNSAQYYIRAGLWIVTAWCDY